MKFSQGYLFSTLILGGYIRKAMIGKEIDIAKRSIYILIIGFLIVGFSLSTYTLYLGLLPFAKRIYNIVN